MLKNKGVFLFEKFNLQTHLSQPPNKLFSKVEIMDDLTVNIENAYP
jgi:hypothetical protein